jgi:3-oxoacyl-[acyl-carrier-protein] synthase-3
MVASSKRALAGAGCGADEIALIVPHQANLRIIESACQRLGIPLDRAAIVLDRTGNTSSASIPLALIDAVRADRLSDGDLILLTGFGAGMTWASAIVRWRVSSS